MKLYLLLAFLLLVQGCATQPITQQSVASPGNPPKHWQATGRIGSVIDGKSQNLSFTIKFNDQAFDLELTGALGLGQISIISTIKGLQINHQNSKLNLKQWMNQNLGWHFPLEELPALVFRHHLPSNDNWKAEVTKFMLYQNNSVVKKVKINHQNKPIKIKLLFKEINQLK